MYIYLLDLMKNTGNSTCKRNACSFAKKKKKKTKCMQCSKTNKLLIN